MAITVKVDTRALKRELRKLDTQLKNFKKALELVGEEIEEVIDRAFAEKRSPSGNSWAPWSETTKRVSGTRGSLLNRTGRLKSSIRVVVRNRDVSIEVVHVAGAVHQFGFPGNKAWGKGNAPIPARPFLPIKTVNDLDPDMIQRINEILNEYFEVS